MDKKLFGERKKWKNKVIAKCEPIGAIKFTKRGTKVIVEEILDVLEKNKDH